jgi:Na+-translocating ferredoxin:NAD+ oxidoreductase RnfD subunit
MTNSEYNEMPQEPEALGPRSPGRIESALFYGGPTERTRPYRPSAAHLSRYLIVAPLILLPALAAATWVFGWRVFAVAGVALAADVTVQAATMFARKRSRPTGGAIHTAVLAALVLPPALPLWMVAVGVGFAVLLGREIFGGVGHQLFQPVVLARVALLVSYPVAFVGVRSYAEIDVLVAKAPAGEILISLLVMALLVLVATGACDWRIILSAMAFAIAGETLARVLGSEAFAGENGLLAQHAFWFALILLAPDPAVAPGPGKRRLIYGGLLGLLAVLLFQAGQAENAIFYAILLGNVASALIDETASRRTATESTAI